MSALPFLWSSGTITLSPWRRQDPALTALQENPVTTVASKLSFGICNAPQMEMFIWSCSTEASHWIKTSLRVTCGSYLSLQLPDTCPQNRACKNRRIELQSAEVLAPASQFLIGSWGWLLWQGSMSSLLEVAVTNHGMSVRLTTSAQFVLWGHLWGPPIDLQRFDPIWYHYLTPFTFPQNV